MILMFFKMDKNKHGQSYAIKYRNKGLKLEDYLIVAVKDSENLIYGSVWILLIDLPWQDPCPVFQIHVTVNLLRLNSCVRLWKFCKNSVMCQKIIRILRKKNNNKYDYGRYISSGTVGIGDLFWMQETYFQFKLNSKIIFEPSYIACQCHFT